MTDAAVLNETMWAQALVGPSTLQLTQVPTPSLEDLGPTEVVLKVRAGGICGSDLPRFRGKYGEVVLTQGRASSPLSGYPMHEVAGEVVATGDPGYQVGDLVVGWASGFDALAEYCRADTGGLHRYEQVDDPIRAIALQPLACVLEAMERVPVEGKRVLILGLGPIGSLFAHVCKDAGAALVTAVDPLEREGYEDFGVDSFIRAHSRQVAEAQDGAVADVVIEAVGHQCSTLPDAIRLCVPEGLIYYFGIPDDDHYAMPMTEFLRKNLTLVAGVTRHRARALAAADAYVGRHPELPARYVTDVFPASQAQQAFEAAQRPRVAQLKLVVSM